MLVEGRKLSYTKFYGVFTLNNRVIVLYRTNCPDTALSFTIRAFLKFTALSINDLNRVVNNFSLSINDYVPSNEIARMVRSNRVKVLSSALHENSATF
jgi:hypothetical protein